MLGCKYLQDDVRITLSEFFPNSPSPFNSRGFRLRPELQVRIDEADQIVWETNRELSMRPVGDRRVSFTSLLEAFTRLDGKKPEQLLGFARKYGPLGLCRHGSAMGHRAQDARCYESTIKFVAGLGVTRGDGDLPHRPVYKESIDAWRRYTRRANGIITVANKLHSDRRASKDDWAWRLDGIRLSAEASPLGARLALGKSDPNVLIRYMANLAEQIRGTPLDALMAAKKDDQVAADHPLIAVLAAQPINTVAQQKRTLASFVNHWLDECQVTIALDWSGPVIDFRLGPSHPIGFSAIGPLRSDGPIPEHLKQWSSLRGTTIIKPIELTALGAIGAQLLWAVMHREGHVRCSACQCWYPAPGRRPRANQNHFCPECGIKANHRFAARKYRAKKMEKSHEQAR